MGGECSWVAPALLCILICLQSTSCMCFWSQQICVNGGLPPPQPLQEDDPRRLTDAGTQAFACALAAAKPFDRPTLEYLRLDGQLAVGAATAAALSTAPFRQVSQLSLMYGGAQQLVGLRRSASVHSELSVSGTSLRSHTCLHTRVVQMWLHSRMDLLERCAELQQSHSVPILPLSHRNPAQVEMSAEGYIVQGCVTACCVLSDRDGRRRAAAPRHPHAAAVAPGRQPLQPHHGCWPSKCTRSRS